MSYMFPRKFFLYSQSVYKVLYAYVVVFCFLKLNISRVWASIYFLEDFKIGY